LLIATAPGNEIPSASVGAELARARRFYAGLHQSSNLTDLGKSEDALSSAALDLASAFGASQKSSAPKLTLRVSPEQMAESRNHDFEALFQYLRDLATASSKVRTNYWQLNSTPPQDRPQKVQQLRKELAGLVGAIPIDPIPLRPRTSLIGETEKFLAYDVLLDVAPGVEAYGQLLVPRAVAGYGGKRLPAVICQHGFDGAPKYVSGIGSGLESNDHFYHRFGQRLAERGYVVFAPYLSVPMVSTQPHVVYRADLVNPLVRQAASLGVMRTSIELAKLHRVVDFLQSLPFVKADRIGYYGLSYGGYSAIWMPPLEPRLSLTVISAHFNDWQTMLTDMERFGASYWTLPDEDFYNWNVLNRFDHTQLIAAMWPRPVCIEYGSDDQVTTPQWHERAWKEVKAFADSWGVNDKIVDDKFNGPHSIHGIGTFTFLDRWLRPERPAGRDYGCRHDEYCYESVAPGFHGYIRDSKQSPPYITRVLDSNKNSMIRGTFYVSNVANVFRGMAFKIARNGTPGDIIVKFGSTKGSGDIGEARIDPKKVHPREDRWCNALLQKSVRLDSAKTYYYEITPTSGQAPTDGYTIFGPKPLGGEDYPVNFGLSFRTLTTSRQ
jgi:dienelactone hydrolase